MENGQDKQNNSKIDINEENDIICFASYQLRVFEEKVYLIKIINHNF